MPKRILIGKVTSNKADKTISVIVERRIMHPMYKKFVTKSKKFAAHDSENKFKEGDIVSIRECAPISKNKRFEVIY
jgi:small subunit ribosomal protein S17